jgi:ABC-2 type transport system ATP-binding protein
VRELVTHQQSLYPRRLDVDDVISLVGLDGKADERVKTLSGGQRRRLDLALGLVGDPELLFLDEPTTGFDPSARRRAWELVHSLRDLGKTVLLTTHYLDEAEHLADRVGVLVAGRLVALGTPQEVGETVAATSVVTFRLPPEADGLALPDLGVPLSAQGADWQLRTSSPTQTLARLTGWAIERGLELPVLTVARPSLEEVYLELVAAAGSPAQTGRHVLSR